MFFSAFVAGVLATLVVVFIVGVSMTPDRDELMYLRYMERMHYGRVTGGQCMTDEGRPVGIWEIDYMGHRWRRVD